MRQKEMNGCFTYYCDFCEEEATLMPNSRIQDFGWETKHGKHFCNEDCLNEFLDGQTA